MAWLSAGSQWGMPEDETTSLRHYFLFRGLYGTSKAFENELKQDKEKAFRVDKIMDQILQYITTYDIIGLRDYWNFLEMRIFSTVDTTLSEDVPKLLKGLLRYYVTYAHLQGKNEKVVEFFDKMSIDLSNNVDWKEWFMMPFLKNPDSYNTFEMYFNKQWQDTLMLSLHNFLCLVLSNMKKPTVLGFEEDKKKIDSLELENALLKRKVEELRDKLPNEPSLGMRGAGGEWVSSSMEVSIKNLELLDDFHELNNSKKDSSSTPKTVSSSAPTTSLPLMSFLKNFTSAGASVKKSSQSSTKSVQSQSSELSGERSNGATNEVQSVCSRTNPHGDSTSSEADCSEKAVTSCPQAASEDLLNDLNLQLDPKLQDYEISSQEIYTDHTASVVTCRFSSTGRSVVSLDSDGILKIWSCTPSPKTISGTMSKSVLTTIEWLPASDRFLLLGSRVGDLKLFDAKERKVIKDAHVDVNFPKLSCISVYPDGTSFVTSSHGRVVSGSSVTRMNQFRLGLLTLWDLNSDIRQKRFLPISPGPVAINSTTYNQSGNLLLTGGCDGRIRIYDVRCQNSVADWTAHDADVHTVSFASNSSGTCFSFAADGCLAQWSLEKTGCKVDQFDVQGSISSRGSFCSIGGGGKSFVLNSSNSHVLIGQDNTSVIYKINAKLDQRSSLPIGALVDGTNWTTCVDWSEHKSPNVCLTGTQKGVIAVTLLEPRT